ncbi:MAG: thiamine pyrophosphate-dependent dehydrogenase E1 component subunit alpha [Gammaproteobacteria bacterium]
MTPSPDLCAEMYRRLLRIRGFEDTCVKLVERGEVPGALHTSHGQEGEIVGACMALRRDDYMVGNHRSHGHPIGKGADLKGLMAELFGRVTGVCRGKGGSMHLADFSVGSVGETSIVGSGLPVAAGAALGAKMLGTDRVCLCFFGDGASNQGAFHESLNLAAVWKLPAIFLCENNGYGQASPAAVMVSVRDVAQRAAGYDIPGVVVDGQDVIAVYEAVKAAVERARAGGGPSLVEAKTYRYMNHALQMNISNYRSEAEIDRWKARDPIALFRARCLGDGWLSESALREVEAEVARAVDEAIAFARNSPYPEAAETFTNVYSNPIQAH